MATTQPLTTTSYAILGLLAVKPWTTYELAQQMGRAMGHFWPRAESKLYEEPKKLVAHGLARASAEAVGKRSRTVYAITPKGRRALRRWMAEDGTGPVLEYEQLIRVFFAEHGTKDDLVAAIASARHWAEEVSARGAAINRPYLEGRGPFPDRLPWIILVGRFLDDFAVMVERWAEWAADVVDGWPDDITAADPDWVTLEAMAVRAEAALARLSVQPRG